MKHAHSHLWPAVPLALVSAVLFGASAPFAKLLLGEMSPQLLAGLLYFGAGAGLAVVQRGRAACGIPAPEAPLRRHDLPWLAAVVLCGGLAGPLMLMLGLRHLGAARTGAYFALAPFIGALIAVTLLHEPVTVHLVAAGPLMGVGLWLHLAERHDHEHLHDALDHEHVHVHDEHHRHHHDGQVTEPHSHWHRHEPLKHTHPHHPDLHHQHRHA